MEPINVRPRSVKQREVVSSLVWGIRNGNDGLQVVEGGGGRRQEDYRWWKEAGGGSDSVNDS